jgi:hypothetical protein
MSDGHKSMVAGRSMLWKRSSVEMIVGLSATQQEFKQILLNAMRIENRSCRLDPIRFARDVRDGGRSHGRLLAPLFSAFWSTSGTTHPLQSFREEDH